MRRLFSLFNVVCLALLVASVLAWQNVQKPPPTPALPKMDLVERTPLQVKVYFTDAQVQGFKPETRTIQILQKKPGAIAQASLNVWAAGPAQAGHLPVVRKGTPAPKVYVRSKHYFVDMPSAYANLKYGTSGERVLICTIVRTLLETEGEDVTFLLNGQNVDSLGHLDLREPFKRQDCADQ